MTIIAIEWDRERFSKSKARKPTSCARCRGHIAVGDPAYRPLNNGMKRMLRLCSRCVGVLYRGGAKALVSK